MSKYRLNNVSIGFKNFSGAKAQFNAAGRRNFHVFFNDEDEARYYANLGFNVKFPEINENIAQDPDRDLETYKPRPHMKVNVNMESQWPPKIALIKKQGDTFIDRTLLTSPDSVGILDNMYIEECEIEITDHHYEGYTTAYLATLYAVVRVDEFYERYGI